MFKIKDKTDKDQKNTETTVKECYKLLYDNAVNYPIKISEVYHKNKHLNKALSYLNNYSIPYFFEVQKPWVLYWSLNAIYINSDPCFELDLELRTELSDYVLEFQHEEGGFSGSKYSYPNLISSYAAILAMMVLNVKDKLQLINKQKMEIFLLNMKNEDGSFNTHYKGESDIRALFAAVLIMDVLNINNPKLKNNIADYLIKNQSYDGGISPNLGSESHAGYTYCGVAALAILKQLAKLDLLKLKQWLILKQKNIEGGFCGRANKLVDSCYTFWVGSIFSIIDNYEKDGKTNGFIYNQDDLLKYVIFCCQSEADGLKDKPEKNPDIYHSMYAASGFNICYNKNYTSKMFDFKDFNLREIDPIYNIPTSILNDVKSYNL